MPPPEPVATADAFPLFSSAGFETGGFAAACRYTPAIADRGSIDLVRAAVKVRAQRGIEDLNNRLRAMPATAPERPFLTFQMHATIGLLLMYEGKFDEAAGWTQTARWKAPHRPARRPAREPSGFAGRDPPAGAKPKIAWSASGRRAASFRSQPRPYTSGHRARARQSAIFASTLPSGPKTSACRWLLNIAYMTVGEYPDKVPADQLIGLERFQSTVDIGRFDNVATAAGLTVRGANMAGGSVFDDFTGDGLPDILASSYDTDLGASLFVNKGDGTFDDRSVSSGLTAQPLAFNVSSADFDNDGRLDVLLLRGGWEKPARLSLLRNKGDGLFDDVTLASGPGRGNRGAFGAWGDFDNDGKVDLFVCGEYGINYGDGLYGGEATLSLSDPQTAAGSITIAATARLSMSPQPPASPTTGSPRVQPGEIMTPTACSTFTSPTSEAATASTTIAAMEHSMTSPSASALSSPKKASPAGSGTLITTAASISSSMITGPTFRTPPRATSACPKPQKPSAALPQHRAPRLPRRGTRGRLERDRTRHGIKLRRHR